MQLFPKSLCWVIITLGAMGIASSVISTLAPNLLLTLVYLACIALLIVLLLVGTVMWVTNRRAVPFSGIPPVLCFVVLLLFWAVIPIQTALIRFQFRRHIDEYMAVVRDLKAGTILTDQTLRIIDLGTIPRAPREVIGLKAAHCGSGTIIAEFLVSAEGRVHRGYVFDDCNNANLHASAFAVGRIHTDHIIGNWYEFSD